jgi:hypothetical protein
LVANKRVAVIGPAPYLKGAGRGKEFDNCDVIVRPNEIIPLSHLRNDYGNRTDILFCNFGTIWMPGIMRKMATDDHLEYFKKLKLVVASGIKAKHEDTDFLSWPDDYVNEITTNFNSINRFDIPFYWIGVKDYKTLYRQVGVEFNTGFGAILMLLHYPIKELVISGFTFYLGGNSYEELFNEGHMDSKDRIGRTWSFSEGHGAYANTRQIQIFKDLYKRYPQIIKIDETMKKVLSL